MDLAVVGLTGHCADISDCKLRGRRRRRSGGSAMTRYMDEARNGFQRSVSSRNQTADRLRSDQESQGDHVSYRSPDL